MWNATTNRTVENRPDTQRIWLGDEGPRILVVDDDPDSCGVMAKLLVHAGFVAVVASNGQDALDKARTNPPRVIVLDMVMPVMDGWTFLVHQRDDTTLGSIPVVIVSGAPQQFLQNLGVAAALQKPFRPAQLIATIRAHC